MNSTTSKREAIISDCGQYRYKLTRRWNEGTVMLPIVMLNPSTADAYQDDPTIRRCVSFAIDADYGGIMVVNVYALRSPSPDALWEHADPIGPDNPRHLRSALAYARDKDTHVLCAWGNHSDGKPFMDLLRPQDRDRLVCLGTTKVGRPRHPLYVPSAQKFERFA